VLAIRWPGTDRRCPAYEHVCALNLPALDRASCLKMVKTTVLPT
jgi:hypothetical protein